MSFLFASFFSFPFLMLHFHRAHDQVWCADHGSFANRTPKRYLRRESVFSSFSAIVYDNRALEHSPRWLRHALSSHKPIFMNQAIYYRCIYPYTYFRRHFLIANRIWLYFPNTFLFLEGNIFFNLLCYFYFVGMSAQAKIMIGKKVRICFSAKHVTILICSCRARS